MSERGQLISELPVANTVTGNNRIIISSNTDTNTVTITNLAAAFPANLNFSAGYSLSVDTLVIRSPNTATPANSSSLPLLTKGNIFYDANYIYIAVANGIVKRAALSSF